MRILVFSDTHQYSRHLQDVVRQNLDADMFFHLGDGQREVSLLLETYPQIAERFYFVRGNCDYGSDAPLEQIVDVMPGHRIFAVHGHRYQVKYSLDYLARAANEAGCDIALFGHTHQSRCDYAYGIHFLNPGSASCPRDGNSPSYGVLDVSSAGVMTNVVFRN